VKDEIVITGIGVVKPPEYISNNIDRDNIWDASALCDKEITKIPKEYTDKYLAGASTRLVDRQSIYSGIAAKLAMENVGEENLDKQKTGMILGSAFGAIASNIDFGTQIITQGATQVNPGEFPNVVSNVAVSRIGIWHKLKGHCTAISNGMLSGLDAIGFAFGELTYGTMENYVAGASEELCKELCTEYMNWIRKNTIGQNDYNQVLAEGAVMFLLQKSSIAQSSKTEKLGNVLEYKTGTLEDSSRWILDMKDIISTSIWNNNLNADEVDIYTTALPFSRYYNEMIQEFKNNRLRVPNLHDKTYINTFGMNGALNILQALKDLKYRSDIKAALIIDVDFDLRYSYILVRV